MHAGAVVEQADDLFGHTVNVAARVAAEAGAGRVLATEPVAHAARLLDIDATPLGQRTLRNIAEPVHLFEIELCSPVAASSVDPVCRMSVHHGADVFRLRHGREELWFCSVACVERFAQDPERYANG